MLIVSLLPLLVYKALLQDGVVDAGLRPTKENKEEEGGHKIKQDTMAGICKTIYPNPRHAIRARHSIGVMRDPKAYRATLGTLGDFRAEML